MSFYDPNANAKMHRKSYRFYWFARTSWGFMAGQRVRFLTGFYKAWVYFNRSAEEDLRREAKR